MGVVLPPTHILSQLLIHSCQCLCSAPYTRNGYQWLDEEGSISQEVVRVSRRSRCQKVGHDLYNKNSQKRIPAKYFLYSLQINYLHWKLSASTSIFSCYATYAHLSTLSMRPLLPKTTSHEKGSYDQYVLEPMGMLDTPTGEAEP